MKFVLAALAVTLSAPAFAASAPAPALSGALLSTNMSSAVLRLNNMVGVNTNGMFGSGMMQGGITTSDFTPGGNGGANPVQGSPNSPENGTVLLAILGVAGLLVGRFGFARTQRNRGPVVA